MSAQPTVPDQMPIASRGYWDLVRGSNPDFSPVYFGRPTEELTPAEEMRAQFGNPRGWVWLRIGSKRKAQSDLATFTKAILPQLRHPIKLVTTDGDNSIPGDLAPGVAETLLRHPLLKRWFTQNYDRTILHEKLKGIPIGLDLHTSFTWEEKSAQIHEAASRAPPFELRNARILFDGTNKSHQSRVIISWLVSGCPHIEVMKDRLSFSGAMKKYAEHQFVVSPRGNGLDCHRTWEVLFLGSVPIVLESTLSNLFNDDMPIVVVKSWKEICDPANVERWARDLASRVYARRRWLDRSFWLV